MWASVILLLRCCLPPYPQIRWTPRITLHTGNFANLPPVSEKLRHLRHKIFASKENLANQFLPWLPLVNQTIGNKFDDGPRLGRRNLR
jgi:hypothetical protein